MRIVDIAGRLGIPVGTVKSDLARASEKLKLTPLREVLRQRLLARQRAAAPTLGLLHQSDPSLLEDVEG